MVYQDDDKTYRTAERLQEDTSGRSVAPSQEPRAEAPAEPKPARPHNPKRDGYAFEEEPALEGARPPRKPSRLEQYIGQVLSGNILTKAEVRNRYPYVFFTAFLMFLYIANIFHTQKLYRQHDRLSAQLKEMRAKSLTVASMRMMATRQSEIVRELEKRGIPLRESVTPPQVIEK